MNLIIQFFLILILIFKTTIAFSSTGSLYGYGAKASATSNTALSGSNDAFSVYYNPASLSKLLGFNFGFALSYAHPSFLEAKSIVIDNSATKPISSDQVGDISNNDYLDHLSQTIAACFNLGENLKNLSFGILTSLPLNRLMYADSGEPFRPEYLSYRSDTQRPEIYMSSSIKISSKHYLGLGLKFIANMASQANFTITSTSGTVSYGRFNTVVKPSFSPYFSWLYEHNKSQNLSLVVRAPSQYKLDLQTRSDARVLGGGSSTPINLNASSILYYEPLSIHLSHSILLSRNFTLFSELEYQNSSKTKAPTLSIQDENSAFQIINSVDSSPKFQDILIPKLGLNYEVNEVLSTRFGYYFKKSIVKDNSGSGNIVDPSKHVFSLGAGFDLKNAKLTDKSISLDFYTQFHWLLKTTIQKSQNNEANNSSSQKIGSPTFLAGGKIYSLGISISMLF